jgi:hypothetical protein
MAFRLRIVTNHDAFHPKPNYEIARILRAIATDLELRNAARAVVCTSDGSTVVGEWRFTFKEKPG